MPLFLHPFIQHLARVLNFPADLVVGWPPLLATPGRERPRADSKQAGSIVGAEQGKIQGQGTRRTIRSGFHDRPAFFGLFALAQRAAAAFFPCWLSSSFDRVSARFLPPLRPSETAAGFFVGVFSAIRNNHISSEALRTRETS